MGINILHQLYRTLWGNHNEIKIIDDETNPNNPFSSNKHLNFTTGGGVLPYSNEGFAENPEKQEELAQYLIEKLDLKKRGALLDVGYGSNYRIVNTFAKEGIHAFAIDLHEKNGRDYGCNINWGTPKKYRTNGEGVEIFSGNIANISDDKSDLLNKEFGLILYNGSWTSGGNNWTVKEMACATYHNTPELKSKRWSTHEIAKYVEQQMAISLQQCKNHLTPNGVIGIVSSRYAFHGAGYDFNRLYDEKLSVIDACKCFQDLGAKKIGVIGVTQEGFDRMVEQSIKQYNEMDGPKNPGIADFYLSQESIDSTIANLKKRVPEFPELDGLARIDAIFAKF